MGLFGALTSGVSGLVAQSSAMSAIADNITNVNTVGYKNVTVDFQTLVTKQTSVTFYSAGGVQSKPLAANDVQGLLQASTSQTDIGISGAGFFVVNESSAPSISSQYLFTRAGSFFQDEEGFLRNTGGFYLQGWPTDADGNVVLPNGSSATLTNQNIISNQFLETVNLNRIGGTAAATGNISMGANLPSTDSVGDSHSIDVQFFDTLGATHDVRFLFTKSAANQWDLIVEPPSNTTVLTTYDSSGNVQKSTGQLQFTAQPADAATVDINGTTYEFDNNAAVGGGNVAVTIGGTLSQSVANLIAAVQANDADFDGTAGDHTIAAKAGNANTVILTGGSGGGLTDFTVDISNLNDGSGNAVTVQAAAATSFTVERSDNANPAIVFDATGLPSSFNASTMSVIDFVSGAADMNDTDLDGDGDVDVPRVTLDFGTAGEANGMTQFGAEFTPTFIQQNGSRFGVFAGVTIDADGLMTALFDNGELRPIFQIPVATFVNPNGLESRTGNVWNATEESGDPTLRVADNGPAGQVIQATLEASTVDLGEEFTNMIIVQRAYSAATKIMTTADEMLEELIRAKR